MFGPCVFRQTDSNLAVSKATFCQVYKVFSESRRLRLRIPLLGPVQILETWKKGRSDTLGSSMNVKFDEDNMINSDKILKIQYYWIKR